ncbi:hypothetical protein ACFWNR_21280 [Streptomyces virginiae]|uniref:hypothetical protein n=1 Tax=Streptomyces virginiae TaxID=1961 RepID=UPI003646D2A4
MTTDHGFTCSCCGSHHAELPLAVEQRTGITLDRVREIAAALRPPAAAGGGPEAASA